jgi:DNA adenine methylase
MLYLSRIGFNGLWRVNKSGKHNVPFGKYTNPTICDASNLRAVSAALKQVTLLSGDFETAVAPAVRGDFVYCDPPYWPASHTANFTSYRKDPFGPAEQERLRDTALELKKRGVHVLLSNADVPEIRKLYARGFKIESVQATRNVNSKGDRRGKVGELLIT